MSNFVSPKTLKELSDRVDNGEKYDNRMKKIFEDLQKKEADWYHGPYRKDASGDIKSIDKINTNNYEELIGFFIERNKPDKLKTQVPIEKYCEEKVTKVFDQCTHLSFSKFFLEYNTKQLFISTSLLTRKTDWNIYKYNNKKTLYENITFPEFTKLIQCIIDDYFQKYEKNIHIRLKDEKISVKDKELLEIVLKSCKKAIKCIGNINIAKNISETVAYSICCPNFSKALEKVNDVINFPNGILNIRTLEFRERTALDLYEKSLDFNYDIKIDEAIHKKIEDIFLQIYNGKRSLVKGIKEFYGYCMTGSTIMQRAMFSIGHTAANGKTTLIEAFVLMFSCYSKKMNRQVFSEQLNNKHKHFSDLPAIRFAYIEEIKKDEKQDSSSLKDAIGSSKLGGVEVLYGTTKDIEIGFKLMFTANCTPKFEGDAGMDRRGLLLEHTNQFLDPIRFKQEQKKNPEKINKSIFLGDPTLISKFSKSEYKLALLQILLPYAKMFYEKNTCDNWIPYINNWAKCCHSNDRVTVYVDECYQITNDHKNDKVTKDFFIHEYEKFYKLNNIGWPKLLNDVKRLGLTYEGQLRHNGSTKGILTGIKFIKQDDRVDGVKSESESEEVIEEVKKVKSQTLCSSEENSLSVSVSITETETATESEIEEDKIEFGSDSTYSLDCYD